MGLRVKCCATARPNQRRDRQAECADHPDCSQGPAATAQPALDALAAFGVNNALVWYANGWHATGNYEPVTLPQSLVDRVIEDAVPARMVADVVDDPHIVVVASRQ